MLRSNAVLDVLEKRFVGASRIPPVHPPWTLPFPKMGRRESGEALNAFAFPPVRVPYSLRAFYLPAWVACIWLIAIFTSSAVAAAVREIGPIGLTVADLGRELMFYTNTLPFQLVSVSESSGPEADQLLGLANARVRVAELKLGDERILLTAHPDNPGRPIPPDSRSYDHWFQHIAIVVRDMDEAYQQLLRHKVKHVSTAPQTLPAWNSNASGIKAFYFRDPEDHVLEIIYFPPGKGDPKWHSSTRVPQASTLNLQPYPVFLGIDHTAIVVSDTDKSLAFYRDWLGLRVAGESENYGVEQEHLNQVFGARLRITGIRAEKGPGIEFLEYITPPGGRPLPSAATAKDLVFWNTQLIADHLDALTSNFLEKQVRMVSRGVVSLSGPHLRSARSVIVRDLDGHALQFVERVAETAAATRP